ncbi:MAG TPA: hypothetical protein PK006_02515 [Saprospiraceae bacterium]|nr:hypothetical protein [Saprospiraceae bacterium]
MRFQNLFSLFLVFCIATHCRPAMTKDAPIKQEDFVDILAYLAKVESNYESINARERDSIVSAYRTKYLTQKNFSDSLFNAAIRFYNRSEKTIEMIEDEVVKKLQQESAK